MHFNFSRKASFRIVFVCSVFLGAFSGALAWGADPASGSEPESIFSQALTQSPMAISEDGNIVSRISQFEDLFGWEKATGNQTILHQFGVGSNLFLFNRTGLPISISADRSRLLVLENLGNGESLIKVADLNKPGLPSYKISETRLLGSIPRLSPDADRYLFTGFFNSTSHDSIWSMGLSEYLWDVSVGTVQPTGFYSDLVVDTKPVTDSSPTFTSSRVTALAWSADGTEIAYITAGGSPFAYRLMVYNFETKQTEELTQVPFQSSKLEWPQGDFIYFCKDAGNTFSFARVDRKQKVVEDLPGVTFPNLLSLNFSVDGKWAAFDIAAGPALVATLYDLGNKKAYTIQGVDSPALSADGSTLVVRRSSAEAAKLEKPFWVAKVADLMSVAKDGRIELTKVQSQLTEAGKRFMAYAIPKEKADFDKNFQWEKQATTSTPTYVSGSQRLTSAPGKYFSSSFTSSQITRCKLTDEAGNLIRESIAPSPAPTHIFFSGQRPVQTYCFINLNGVTIAPGTKAKYSVFLEGYEAASKIEEEIIF